MTKQKKPKKAKGAGHNSQINQALVDILDESLELDDKIRHLNKAKRDLRNKAKTEHGVLAGVFTHEIRLRKMDRDVRVQFESGIADLKIMTGYQIAMDLLPTTVARTEEEYVDPSAVASKKLIHRIG